MIEMLSNRYPSGVFLLGVSVTVPGRGAPVESEFVERFHDDYSGLLG
jgi:hypothetical protein